MIDDFIPDPIDWTRAYWRSTIVAEMAFGLWLAGVIKYVDDFEGYLTGHAESLGLQLTRILAHVCDLEAKTGQRTFGMHEYVRTESNAISALPPCPSSTTRQPEACRLAKTHHPKTR